MVIWGHYTLSKPCQETRRILKPVEGHRRFQPAAPRQEERRQAPEDAHDQSHAQSDQRRFGKERIEMRIVVDQQRQHTCHRRRLFGERAAQQLPEQPPRGKAIDDLFDLVSSARLMSPARIFSHCW